MLKNENTKNDLAEDDNKDLRANGIKDRIHHNDAGDDEENFEDALDDFPDIKPPGNGPTLEEAIVDAMKIIEYFFANDFEKAFACCEKWANESLYHSLGSALLNFLRAWMTLDKPDIKRAMDAIRRSLAVAKARKKSGHLMDVLRRPNYDTFTEEEIHAELAFAEGTFMMALITFVEDQNFVSMVKGGMRFRQGFQSYKECQYIMKHKKEWKDDICKYEYESGVRAGNGIYNLVLSLAPPKIMTILEFVGFSADREMGLDEMIKVVGLDNTLRTGFFIIFLLSYFLYVEVLLGWGELDIDLVQQFLNKQLEKFPKSVFTYIFKAKFTQISGNPLESVSQFHDAINCQNEWKQLHKACYWEIMWTHALECDWKNAAKYADIMRKESQWSPCVFTYQYAVFLYMQMEEEQNYDLKDEIANALREVPKLKKRFAGKSIPKEKFVCYKAEIYFNQNERLLLPALELFHVWNMFSVISRSKSSFSVILEMIERKLMEHGNDKDLADHPYDDYALLLLLKGVCSRYLGFPLQAQECFVDIISNEKRIKVDTYIPAHAAMELGFTFIQMSKYSEAKTWLKKSMKDYGKFSAELLLHLRAFFALRHIKQKV